MGAGGDTNSQREDIVVRKTIAQFWSKLPMGWLLSCTMSKVNVAEYYMLWNFETPSTTAWLISACDLSHKTEDCSLLHTFCSYSIEENYILAITATTGTVSEWLTDGLMELGVGAAVLLLQHWDVHHKFKVTIANLCIKDTTVEMRTECKFKLQWDCHPVTQSVWHDDGGGDGGGDDGDVNKTTRSWNNDDEWELN